MLALSQALETIRDFVLAVEGYGQAAEASGQEQSQLWTVALVCLIGSSSISGCLQIEFERTSKMTGADLAGETSLSCSFWRSLTLLIWQYRLELATWVFHFFLVCIRR